MMQIIMKHACLLGLLVMMIAGILHARSDFDPHSGVIDSSRWNNGVPLGGIGCGKFDVLTDGSFANMTVNHNWDRPTGWLKGSFAAIYTQSGQQKQARLLRLRGTEEYQNAQNIATTRYLGKFPALSLEYRDPALPVEVDLFAYSPLIPNDIKNSGLPVALLSYKVRNTTAQPVNASLLLSWQNVLGFGGQADEINQWENYNGNVQARHDTDRLAGLLYSTSQRYDDRRQNSVGQYYVATPKRGRHGLSTCAMWDAQAQAIPFWAEFSQTGKLTDQAAQAGGPDFRPAAALAVPVWLKAHEEKTIEFVVAWYMPNFITISGDKELKPTQRIDENDFSTNNAFDDNDDTNWNTSRPQKPDDTFSMDFGQPTGVARLVFSAKDKIWDYPRAFRLESSNDGKAWTLVLERRAEQNEKDVKDGTLAVSFDPIKTRFLRIVQTSGDWPAGWSMNELYIHSDREGKTPRIKPVKARSRLRRYGEQIVKIKHKEDVSQYYVNFFESAPAVAEYFIRHSKSLLPQTLAWQNLVWESNLPFWLRQKLINCAFPLVCNTILTKDGRFSNLESPGDMGGSLGTMDQRLASHSLYTMLFPELDLSEVELFTRCQQLVDVTLDEKPIKGDGQIPHFVGNIHERIGNPNVGGGVTQWPDLTCSWVMQTLKLYRWTGDRAFLDRQWPQIEKGMAWLVTRDRDGDLIPEGGSTYDYEPHGGGAFAYTASCYMGALKAAAEMARVQGNTASQQAYEQRFESVRQNAIKSLWNGKFFIKRFEPLTGKTNPNCFIAQMAGDWMSELSGLGNLLPEPMRQSAVREVLARNVLSFYPVPPMEVTAEGKTAVEPCYVLQHEPFIGMEAINTGYVDDGLEVIKRIYDIAWLYNKTPWNQRLWIDTSTGKDHWGGTYMTSGSTWPVMHALLGASVDLPGRTLYLSPRLASDTEEWHLPLFFPRFWAWVDYAPQRGQLTVKVLKTFGEGKLTIEQVVGDQAKAPLKLNKRFVIKEGAVLDLSDSIDQLVKYKQTSKSAPQFTKQVAPLPE